MKKRLLLIIICSIIIGMQKVGAQIAKVALSHNGNITMYNAEELQTAIDASVDGDTLFLNEGTFSGGITISKKISLIGAGDKTVISGNLYISLTGKLTSRMLDAINISEKLYVSSDSNDLLDGLIIRKCVFKSFDTGTSLTNAIIDRCYQTNVEYYLYHYFKVSSNFKHSNVIKVVNSVIGCYHGYDATINNTIFVNCNVKSGYAYDKSTSNKATFYNCIVDNFYSKANFSNSQFIYCYLKIDSGTTQNCQFGTITWDGVNCTSTNMLGQDGTPVGIDGGTTPYTLVPTTPKMESFDLKVDTQSKKLNVNIKMTAN
ncbi:MAG: hypothetical protein IJP74_02390 [Prevotella sp.]|nr:hypothetical protein [Prevotella sp.]